MRYVAGIAVALPAVLLCGCALYTDDAGDDDDDDDGPRACLDVEQDWWRAVRALDGSCARDEDCVLAREEEGYCDCRVIGIPVNRDVYVGSDAEAIAAELATCTGELTRGCDFGPRSPVCDQGQCAANEDFFCNLPPDRVGSECWPQPAFAGDETGCQRLVCAADPSCCTVGWDAACADRAGLTCEQLWCDQEALIGGDQVLAVAGSLWEGPDGARIVPLAGDGPIGGMALTMLGSEGYALRAHLAVAGRCAGRILRDDPPPGGSSPLFIERYAYVLPGCDGTVAAPRLDGTRALWADLDHDGVLDALFAGAAGAFWARGGSDGWQDGGTLVDGGDGTLTDVALLDADDDLDLDLVATFTDRPAALYRQDAAHAFTHDPSWASVAADHVTVVACQLDADPQRELVLTGPTASEGYDVGPAGLVPLLGDAPVLADVGGATHVACGALDPARGPVAVLAGVDGGLRIVAVPDGVVWSSLVDLSPPLAVAVAGMDVALLRNAAKLVVAAAGASGDVPYFSLVRDATSALSFTVDVGVDPVPDDAATTLLVGHLQAW